MVRQCRRRAGQVLLFESLQSAPIAANEDPVGHQQRHDRSEYERAAEEYEESDPAPAGLFHGPLIIAVTGRQALASRAAVGTFLDESFPLWRLVSRRSRVHATSRSPAQGSSARLIRGDSSRRELMQVSRQS